MTTRRAILATAGCLAVAGCATRRDDGPASPTDSPTDDPDSPTDDPTSPTDTPTDDPNSPTDTPTDDPTSPTDTPTGTATTVTYVLRSGPIPEAFAAATATVQAVFVEDRRDLGPCYPEVHQGPYEPTITPIATPRGACHAEDPIEVDLVGTDERTIEATAPPWADGHALVATRVVGTDQDGDDITAIEGTGGVRLIEEPSPPSGAYGVEMGIDVGPEEADYDYWVTTERIDPDP